MEFDGALAQAQFARHHFVGASCDEQCQHIPLASGQGLEPLSYLLALTHYSAILSVMVERLAHTGQQGMIRDRLLKKVKRSLQHGLDGHRNLAVTGDEDERNDRAA